jgi:hypothetical protein
VEFPQCICFLDLAYIFCEYWVCIVSGSSVDFEFFKELFPLCQFCERSRYPHDSFYGLRVAESLFASRSAWSFERSSVTWSSFAACGQLGPRRCRAHYLHLPSLALELNLDSIVSDWEVQTSDEGSVSRSAMRVKKWISPIRSWWDGHPATRPSIWCAQLSKH